MIGAEQLGALDNVGFRRPQHVRGGRSRLQVEGRLADRKETEVVMVSPVPLGGTRAAVARLAEIVARLVETASRPICGITGVETARSRRNVEYRPMTEHSGRRIRILDDEDEASGSVRQPGPCQRRRDNGAVAGELRWDLATRRDRRAGKQQGHGRLL